MECLRKLHKESFIKTYKNIDRNSEEAFEEVIKYEVEMLFIKSGIYDEHRKYTTYEISAMRRIIDKAHENVEFLKYKFL